MKRTPLSLSQLQALNYDLPGTASDLQYNMGYNFAGQIIQSARSHDGPYAWKRGTFYQRDYQVNGQNQYQKTVADGVDSPLTHDMNGNLGSWTVDGATTSYVYDVENRLVRATTGATATELLYDPLGRLFEVKRGAEATQFLYDGDELVAEYAGSGNVPLRRYVHGAGADDPIALYEGPGIGFANRAYHQTDPQGSIVALINADGTLRNVNAYDEYGIPAETNVGRFQYTGQAWIGELGLYHYKARFYSPTLGRFMQVDPIGYDDQINLYAYVENDPVNHTDPTGTYGERSDALANLMETLVFEAAIRSAKTPAQKERIARQWRQNFVAKGNHFGASRATEVANANRPGKLSKVPRSTSTRQLGKFSIKTKVVPGNQPGQSRAEYRTVKTPDGRTIRTYKDSYDRSGKFQGRSNLRGGPEGRPANDPPSQKRPGL